MWTSNLGLDMCLLRSLDAKHAGFSGGIWFALATDTTVYGVVEFLGLNIAPSTNESLEIVEQFGKSIGRLLEFE